MDKSNHEGLIQAGKIRCAQRGGQRNLYEESQKHLGFGGRGRDETPPEKKTGATMLTQEQVKIQRGRVE